jgi:hypothetical protein
VGERLVSCKADVLGVRSSHDLFGSWDFGLSNVSLLQIIILYFCGRNLPRLASSGHRLQTSPFPSSCLAASNIKSTMLIEAFTHTSHIMKQLPHDFQIFII